MPPRNFQWTPVIGRFLSTPVLWLVISSDIRAAQFLHQDTNDADEQDEIDLKDKNIKVKKAKKDSETQWFFFLMDTFIKTIKQKENIYIENILPVASMSLF